MPYFTIFKTFLVAPYELSQKEQEKLNEFLQILEESNVGSIIQSALEKDKRKSGRPRYNPFRLFAALVYGFSKHSASLRKIQESMLYDLRFIYLMDGDVPSYVTIGDFLNNVVVPHQKCIFSSIVSAIIAHYNINTCDVFVDGTKFEANANKYKFVWKPSTFHKHLNENIKKLLLQYFHLPLNKTTFLAKEIADYLSNLSARIAEQNLSLQTGRGIRSPQIVKDYLTLSKYLLKTLEYEEKCEICGPNRQSYYKTDHDATAMTLKSDYYSGVGSVMRAGYNIQIIVARGFVLFYHLSQDRNDFAPFIPLLDGFYAHYNYYPRNLCADAGYSSTANYQYLHDHHITNYIKFQNWQQERDGKTIPLYSFDDENNLICLNGKKAPPLALFGRSHPKSKHHFFYNIPDCAYCRYKKICYLPTTNKKANSRTFQVNTTLDKFKNEARTNLLSLKGIEMRVNRSSQVEGVYGIIKQDMNYTRLRRRGLTKSSAEIMLVCLGYNIKKLFTLIDGTAKLDYWQAPPNLQPELFTKPSIKKIMKRKKRPLSENEKNIRNQKKSYKKRDR